MRRDELKLKQLHYPTRRKLTASGSLVEVNGESDGVRWYTERRERSENKKKKELVDFRWNRGGVYFIFWNLN